MAWHFTPYARASHEGFVLASWEGRAPAGAPGANRAPLNDRRVMHALLRRADVRCVVAVHWQDPDTLLGWCAAQGNALLWVYVRDLYGRGLTRRKGLGCALMLEAGIDPAEPTPCRFWSPYATVLAERGYRLIYAPKGAESRIACA